MKQIDLNNEIVIYQSEDGKTQLDVKLEGETVWLTQAQMSELFQTDRTVINRHIRNIYKSGELEENATCAKNAQVRIEGNRTVSRAIPYYNLDMIISVGYRVNSIRGVRFRQWANSVLKQYLIKGYAVNERIGKQEGIERWVTRSHIRNNNKQIRQSGKYPKNSSQNICLP